MPSLGHLSLQPTLELQEEVVGTMAHQLVGLFWLQDLLATTIPFGLSGSSDSSVTWYRERNFQYFSRSRLVTTADLLENFYDREESTTSM